MIHVSKTTENEPQDLQAINAQLVSALNVKAAELLDQIDTSATFQQRNAELETHVLQHLKARRQAERALGESNKALEDARNELALLRTRQADAPDLRSSASVVPLTAAAKMPKEPHG